MKITTLTLMTLVTLLPSPLVGATAVGGIACCEKFLRGCTEQGYHGCLFNNVPICVELNPGRECQAECQASHLTRWYKAAKARGKLVEPPPPFFLKKKKKKKGKEKKKLMFQNSSQPTCVCSFDMSTSIGEGGCR
jgi:hypothetical protein